MGLICDKCGGKVSFDVVTTEVIKGEPAYLCDPCREHLMVKRFYGGLVAVLSLALAVFLWRYHQPKVWLACFVWNLFLIQIIESLCVFPHEFGHALAARLMGFKVDRVIIGFGRRLSCFRFAGFQWEIRARPFGGFVKFDKLVNQDWRWRAAVVWAAGPLANILLACAAFALLPPEAGKMLDLGGPVSLWVLFIITNTLMGVINLVPFTVRMPDLGLVPSDGMGLCQLIFEGKWPHASAPDQASLPVAEPGWKKLLRLIAAVVLVLVAFLFLLLVAVVLLSEASEGRWNYAKIVATVVLLVVVGAIFWIALRIANPKRHSTQESQTSSTVGGVAVIDLNNDQWGDNISPPVLQYNLVQAFSQGDYANAEAETNAALEQTPQNLWLQLFRASLLSARNRDQEAEQCLHDILSRTDIQPETRMSILQDRLVLLARLGRKDQVKAEVDMMLQTSFEAIEKARLLDILCCWPFMLEMPEYQAEAEVWIKQAMQLDPDSVTLRGTYAALLVESGRNDVEAEAVLRDLLNQSKAPHDRGIASFYLSLLAKRKGDAVAANDWLKKATQLFWKEWMIKRAKKEFSD